MISEKCLGLYCSDLLEELWPKIYIHFSWCFKYIFDILFSQLLECIFCGPCVYNCCVDFLKVFLFFCLYNFSKFINNRLAGHLMKFRLFFFYFWCCSISFRSFTVTLAIAVDKISQIFDRLDVTRAVVLHISSFLTAIYILILFSVIWNLILRKMRWSHLISWTWIFMESHSFRIVSGESPETMRKLCLSTKFPHQEIR